MPGFPLMPEPEKRDVVAFVRHLAEFGAVRREIEYVMDDETLTLQQVLDERLDALVAEVRADAAELLWPVTVPPDPGSSPALVERGRVLYVAQCVACHGAGGRGDGTSSYHLRDWQDAEIRPRDFTTGVFRAGSAPTDLFLRMRTGLNGTPMPAVSGSDDDLWALVHFILSLKDPAAARGAVHPTSCEAHLAGRSAP
jgi:mono/diheme cytochrome c family protein